MNLWLELKYAWRLLKKSWGYSLLCASVVALSVGLVVFAYSLVYSQLLKPLGFPGSEGWFSVQIAAKRGVIARANVDAYTYQQLLKHARAADYLGAFTKKRSENEKGKAVVLSEGQASTPLRAVAITPRLLASTHVPFLMGRAFEDRDAQPGAARVAVLSYDAWQSYFAGDKNIIGKTARIDAAPVRIIGVLPKDFFMFQDFEVWMPLQMPVLAQPRDSAQMLSPLIELHSGQDIKALTREMQEIVDGVNKDYPDLYNAGRHVEIFPAVRMFTHFQTPIVLMVALMAAALLLLGCVNISMVFLARMLERSRELALRTALGASRARVLRQCLVETVVVVVPGLVAGWLLAAWGVRWAEGIANFSAQTQASGRFPNLLVLRPVDVLIAIASASAIWLLATLVPAWRIAKNEAAVLLAGSGKGSASSSRGNKGVSVLVGLQVAVSAIVLVTCGNMVLAVNKEVSKPTGVDSSNVILSTYSTVFDQRYAQPEQRLRYWENLTAAIKKKIPGSDVAIATSVPTYPPTTDVGVEGQQSTTRQGTLRLPVSVVSDDYFKLLALGLRSGRLFDSTDNSSSLNVAIIDEKLAGRYWPGQDVLGKRVQLNPTEKGPWLTIVGIVSPVSDQPYSSDDGAIYRPLRQAVPGEFLVVVKLPNNASDARVALRAAAFEVDRDLPLHNLQMLDEYLVSLNLRWSTLVQTFAAIALITVLLAASGLFGLISRSVVQRTQEVGIRRALGATTWQATSMFLRQGAIYLAVAIVAVGVGTALMPAMSRVITNILQLVVPVTAATVLLIAAVVFLASYLPSRRAVALEPGDALRYE